MNDIVGAGLELALAVDPNFIINGNDIDFEDDDDNKLTSTSHLQSENPYNKLLPYDISLESYQHLTRIKANLAKAIQCDQYTIFSWLAEFERYLDLYGLAFTKEDHIHFINLFYELLVTTNDLQLIVYVSKCITWLLRKRYLITRDDLTLQWKPLYELYEKSIYNNLEPLGLKYSPENLEASLRGVICLSNPYFALEATQEMLDEWRPMLCLYDSASQKATIYMTLFLPTTLPPQYHDSGYKLWFDEVMQIWLNCRPSFRMDTSFTCLLHRLSYDCLGYIDWEPYIARIFTHFKSCLNLNGMSSSRRGADRTDIHPGIYWIVCMLGGGSSCQRHVSMLFKAIESFYHPSNTDRRWQGRLQQFLYKLPACFISRVYRERYKKQTWTGTVPDSHKLTDNDITEFVQSMVPIVLISMFNHSGVSCAASAFKDLALLRPELVIPPLLERLYGSYETLTEPHRFVSSINCMAAVVPALVKPCKYYPDGPSHVVPLLLNSLPGIDANDMRKTLAVLRFISTLASYIELKDYTHLVDTNDRLSIEQQELCLATSQFEDFVTQFLDKCFVLIENSASATFSHLDQENQLKNREEGIIEAAICSVTLSILSQASQKIQDAALNKLYSHVSRNLFNTKTQGKAIASLCLAFAKSNPVPTLAKFVPHFGRLILTLTDHEDVFTDDPLDDELLFSLLLMSEIVRCYSDHLIEYKDLLIQVLKRALSLTAKEGYKQGCAILRHLLRALTNIACHDWKNVDPKVISEQKSGNHSSDDQEWPFKNWGTTTHLDDLTLDWHIPGPEARAFAVELLDTFLVGAINDLESWAHGSKELRQREQQLHIVLSCLVGSASVLPPMDSEKVKLCIYEVPAEFFVIKNTGTEPMYLSNGTNVRNYLVVAMKNVLQHVLDVAENDFRSLYLICEIFNNAMSYFGFSESEYRLSSQRLLSMKKGLDNKLLGSKRHLRYMLVERVVQQHRAMIFSRGSQYLTQLHIDILDIMFKLATGHYVEVRSLAQDTIIGMVDWYFEDIAERLLVPRIVDELRKPEIEHNKFKGLLYLLGNKRSHINIMIDVTWSSLKEIWPAIVQSPHSEKPSVVRLVDRLCSLVQKKFDTLAMSYEFNGKVKLLAAKMWSNIDCSQVKPFSEEEILTAQKAAYGRGQKSVEDYTQLVLELVNLIENPALHWHRKIIAFSFLSQLVRDDLKMPIQALKLFLSSLISERLSIRKKSVELVAGQLKLHKRKHAKRSIDPSILASSDNSWMQYKLNDKFYTKEQWESLVFIDKPHIGFLCWPKQLDVYDKNNQLELNRSYDKMNVFEKTIYDKFHDEKFIEKLVEYFTFEDSKGSDRFEIKRYLVFKGLFRNYGPIMIEPFRKYVIEYSNSTCDRKGEYKQRFTIEFLAGLIRGAKHWPYEMQLQVKEFTEPIVEAVSLSQENRSDWNTFVDQVFRDRDVRRLDWLLYIIIKKATFECELMDVTPYIQSSRLLLANTVLCQCEWRAVDYVFVEVMRKLSTQSNLLAYANVRTQLAYIYAVILSYDNPNIHTSMSNTLKNGPRIKQFIQCIMPQLAILEKNSKSSPSGEVDLSNQDQQTIAINTSRQVELLTQLAGAGHADTDTIDKLTLTLSTGLGSPEESEERKDAKKLLKLVCLWILYYSFRTLCPVASDIFLLLPVLCDSAGDSTDQELVTESKVALTLIGTMTLSSEAIDEAIESIRKIIRDHSWHARFSLASFLRLVVSSNLFVLLNNPKWIADIRDIVLNSLICDERVEVREATVSTLSGLIHCNFIEIDEAFLREFKRRASTPLIRHQKKQGASTFDAASIVTRHSGILGLCACVEAHPYTVPQYLPEILIFLSDHLSDPQPISVSRIFYNNLFRQPRITINRLCLFLLCRPQSRTPCPILDEPTMIIGRVIRTNLLMIN